MTTAHAWATATNIRPLIRLFPLIGVCAAVDKSSVWDRCWRELPFALASCDRVEMGEWVSRPALGPGAGVFYSRRSGWR